MTLRLRAHVSTTETDDGLVLLDERAGRYWQLNRTGALVLATVLDAGTPQQAVQILVDTYKIKAERAAADVTALLEDLRAAGLVILSAQGMASE